MTDRKPPRFPASFVIGLALLTFAAITQFASKGRSSALPLLLLAVGLVLLCTGLIQRSIERSR